MKTTTRHIKPTVVAQLRWLALLLAISLVPMLTHAANVTLIASDASGSTSMNTVGKWGPDSTGLAALSPQPTNDYYTGPFFIRTPPNGAGITFAGHSLTLQDVTGNPGSGGQGAPFRSILYKGTGGDTIVINNLTNAAGSVLNNGGSGAVTAPVFTGNLWTIAGNSTIISDQGATTIGYPIVGSANLTNCGSVQSGVHAITYTNNLSGFTGKLILANVNGGMVVNLNAGSSNLGNPATPTPDQITIAVGCALTDNAGLTFNNANGGITLIGNGTINSASTTVIAEPITGGFTFTCGAGVLVLSNANNTYTGGTTISAGTLRLGVANALPTNGSVTVTTTLDINTFSTTIDGLGGAGTVDTVAGGTPTLTVGANGGSGTFSGAIRNSSGTLALTKVGAGTETLTGANTYGGTTLVTGGTLSVSTANGPTTAGNLAVSNGAALTVDASSGLALPANNVTFGTNGILNLTITGAANGINAAGSLTFQDNATNNFNFGNLSANPTVAAINAAGGISAPGSNIVININSFGLKPGQFPLIKYTGTPLGGIANFSLGSIPPGVVATLVNNTGNHSIDVNVASAPKQLAWNGVNGTSWDTTTANWTNAFNATITVYQEYAGGTSGDIVTFDDTLVSGNPRPTNINLTAVFHPFPVTANSTLPYMIAGAGGLAGSSGNTGIPYLTKNNTGSFTLLTSNSFTGGVAINAGTLVITNDFALGANASVVTLNGGTLQVNANTTNSVRIFTVPAASAIDVASNVVAQFGGAITGAGGLAKTDSGTLVLTGTNSITGALTVNQGTLTTLGTNVLSAVPIVGNAAGLNGVLNISGGSFRANNNGGSASSSSLTIGGVAGAAGDVFMNSGTLTVNRQLTVGPTGFGVFNQSGGATTIGGFIACGGTGGGGVFNQSGGTVAMNGSSATIGYGITSSYGLMNLSGTAVLNMIGSGNGVWPGQVGSGTLNLSGNASLNITNSGLVLGRDNNTGANGTVNLLGGTATVNSVVKGAGIGVLNFNGGTLKANFATNGFVAGLSGAYVYSGGAKIDDGGFAITIPQPLLAVTNGEGIVSIPLNNGSGSNYIDAPIVTIVDGNNVGSNATAIAQIDPVRGTVTNIVITCPGQGYDQYNSFVSVGFIGGGANPTQPNIYYYDPVFAPNGAGGGLTKTGSGTTTLTGVNTFTGPITNNAGTLSLNSATTYASAAVNGGALTMSTAATITGATTVSNGASFGISQIGSATNTIGALTFNGGAAVPGGTLVLALSSANNAAVPVLNCSTLTVNGTNTISLAGAVKLGTNALVHYSSLVAGSGTFTNLTLPQGATGFISNSVAGSAIYAIVTSTGPGIVWTGTNSNAALTNLWDLTGTTINWLLGATPTAYQQPIIPGDAVTFNDTGSGTVILNVNAGPSSLVISNTSKSYTIRGLGHIVGSTGLQKLGTNTAFLNLTNNSYTGDTVISNGTLQFNNPTALSSSANLNVGPGGILALAGLSTTVGELTGSGIIDNTSGANPTLTVGSSSGGTWNGNIQDHGAGGVALHKVGSGTWFVGGINHLNDGQPFTDTNFIASGTVVITNGGLLSGSDLQLMIAYGAGQVATVVVAGGTLAVTNNVLSVGYGAANGAIPAANGTLTVNSGTVFHGGPGGGSFALVGVNCIDVGAQGATGTLIVNGGQVLNNSVLYLGDGSGAVGTLYLNGGLLQAAGVLLNNGGTANAYFNGGTLQASTNSAGFLQVSSSLVMSNGLVLDDNGYALNIVNSLSGDSNHGGLVKKGSGTVYLDGANSYTGLTVVTNGTLAGIGSVNASVLVATGGTLGAGDAGAVGTFTVGNSGNLTLQGNASLRISKTGGSKVQDNITVSGNITYGGTLTINNITSDGTPLAIGDTFQLFTVTGSKSGNFTSIVTLSGGTYSFDPTTGILTVLSIGPGTFTNKTGITSFSLNGANIVITGTNGQAGDAYYLLQSTNVALPLSQWKVVATNVLSANGNFTFTGTNVVVPGNHQQFYLLSNTNSNH
jgi:autotransporter-associated beta strand protein